MRKALFKRGLERNGKNKNVLEIDVETDGGIIFWKINLSLIKIILFRIILFQDF